MRQLMTNPTSYITSRSIWDIVKFGTFDSPNLTMFQIYLGQFGIQSSLGHSISQTPPYPKTI